MVVDCHTHTRDFKQREKETIEHALNVAKYAGVSGIFSMPNTNPTLDEVERVLEYLKTGEEANVSEVFFGTYMALTKDREQIKRAIGAHSRLFPRVVGFKLYAGHSTGNIGVIDLSKQQVVFETLADEAYTGVLAIHSEKEKKMNNSLFDKNKPLTHATLARPVEAENESVRDMIYLAQQTGFKGKMHIAHISSPFAVALVQGAKRNGLNISSGVCPHHLVYDWTQMQCKKGLLWKMNPPLRKPGYNTQMLELLRNGSIDWIETDHAPHSLNDKLGNNEKGECASGIPALHAWPLVLEYLRMEGFSENRIYEVTHKNIVDRFGIPIQTISRKGIYNPNEYKFNVWEPLEERLRLAN